MPANPSIRGIHWLPGEQEPLGDCFGDNGKICSACHQPHKFDDAKKVERLFRNLVRRLEQEEPDATSLACFNQQGCSNYFINAGFAST